MDEELDIFTDTTASATGLEANEPDQRLYDYTQQRETGDASNLYWGNVSTQLTMAELKEQFNAKDNGQLRKAFGSFDNYMAYMNERQDLIDAGELKADWWDTEQALIDVSSLDREAGMDDRKFEESIRDRAVELATQAYEQQSPVLNALFEKYTGTEGGVWRNTDGDKFEWNGTSFVKTKKIDDSLNVNTLILSLAAAGMAAAVAAPLASKIGASMSASLGLGEKATTALITGLQNGLTSAGSTLIQGKDLTGTVLADSIWGALSPSVISTLDITPDTFVSAFVDSIGSDVVTNFVTGEDFNWQAVLENAAVAGGLEAVKDFFADWLSTKDKEQLRQHYLQQDYEKFGGMSPEDFDSWLLNNPDSMLNTTDLGALVGPEGLLTKVFGFEGTSDYLSTEWFDSGVKTVTDFLGSLGVGKALAAISDFMPKNDPDPFYAKGSPYQWDPNAEWWDPNKEGGAGFVKGAWVLDRQAQIIDEFGNIVDNPNYWTDEEIDRWNQEFLYGGELDERYWHSWQERDPNSTVQGIWENPMTPETGGLSGIFGSLIGTGGGLKIAENALPGTGVPDPKGVWSSLIDTWNNFVDSKPQQEQMSWAEDNGFAFTDLPPLPEDEQDNFPPFPPDEPPLDEPSLNGPSSDELPPPVDELPPEIGSDEPPSGYSEPPAGQKPPISYGVGRPSGDFDPFSKGLSYERVEPVAVSPPPEKDYVGELDQLIQRSLDGLFKDIV